MAIRKRKTENERNVVKRTVGDITTENNKAWVSVTRTINLGNYENIKLECGFSQSLLLDDNPIDVLAEMQEIVQDFIMDETNKIYKAENVKKQLLEHPDETRKSKMKPKIKY